jgi:hypothetical protein
MPAESEARTESTIMTLLLVHDGDIGYEQTGSPYRVRLPDLKGLY